MTVDAKDVPFDKAFLRRLVAVLLREPLLASRVAALLQPRWIEDEVLADVADVAISHIKKYRALPTNLVIREECGSDILKSEPYQAMFRVPTRDMSYVTDKLTDFCRTQAMKEAVLSSVDDINKGNMSPIVTRVQDALKVGMDFSNLGDKFSDWKSRKKYYLEGDRLLGVVPTGWDHVDQIMGGGLGAGELGVIMGPSGGGKSFALMNIGYNAVMQGRRVVHFTFEINTRKLLRRYDKRFVGKHAYLLSEAPDRFIQKLAKQHRLLGPKGEVVVHFAPTRTFTTSMMRTHLDAIITAWDYRPDLVIVDYGDIMRAERRVGEVRHEQAGIYEDLRGIAGEYNVPMWTATQVNRAALSKKVIRKEDIAESFEKVCIADVVFSLCQTPEEKEEGLLRLFSAKLRDAADEKTVSAVSDFGIGWIKTTGISVPVPKEKKGEPKEELGKKGRFTQAHTGRRLEAKK